MYTEDIMKIYRKGNDCVHYITLCMMNWGKLCDIVFAALCGSK